MPATDAALEGAPSDLLDGALDGITISIAASSEVPFSMPASELARLAIGEARGDVALFLDFPLLEVELGLEGGSIMIVSTVVASDLLLLDLLDEDVFGVLGVTRSRFSDIVVIRDGRMVVLVAAVALLVEDDRSWPILDCSLITTDQHIVLLLSERTRTSSVYFILALNSVRPK